MKRFYKLKYYFPIFLVLLVVLTLITNYFNYPAEWDEIKLGQNRNVVHQNLGYPTNGELWDMKGDIWIKHHILSWHRLDVLYGTDTIIYGYSIKFYLGTNTNFYIHHMKSEFRK